MAREIVIDPVTRIEGHAKITIQLDERGQVADAHFHVTQFRGFERICQGRPVHELPSLMARICGICPVSHLVASAKACDQIMATEPPPTGVDLRRVLNLAQIAQSHALSFFHLSSPDLLFGFDAEAGGRHLLGVLGADPQLARDGVGLRRFGQQVIESLGGKRIHPSGVVPGGMEAPLPPETRDRLLAALPEAVDAAERALAWYAAGARRFEEEAATFGDFPSAFMGLVGPDGAVEHYDGALRVVGPDGTVLAERADPRPYWEYLGEAVEPWSYLKSAYWRDLGYPEGIYRVGPLARVNVADKLGSPRADEHLERFRERLGRVPSSSFHYHQARLIEMLSCLEGLEALLRGPEICSPRVRSVAGINRDEGIGVAEAPRGTLLHHYRVDRDGIVQWANLVIATGHNNLAMNKSVAQVARHYVKAERLTEPMLNRVEAVIRCYDPCLSCSTHAIGQMPLRLVLLGPDGAVLDELAR
ncbi:MAG TPA: Ni/Fe hydrogenase subunit alpha [Actinomycetota bacterium]|nr:Ni/Fe hydrogenase subunit alpha [Actinomycetota bacterium]